MGYYTWLDGTLKVRAPIPKDPAIRKHLANLTGIGPDFKVGDTIEIAESYRQEEYMLAALAPYLEGKLTASGEGNGDLRRYILTGGHCIKIEAQITFPRYEEFMACLARDQCDSYQFELECISGEAPQGYHARDPRPDEAVAPR